MQPWTLRLGPVVLVGVVLRRPSRVRREAVVDELPREVETRRGASRREEARAGVARRRERRRHRMIARGGILSLCGFSASLRHSSRNGPPLRIYSQYANALPVWIVAQKMKKKVGQTLFF